MNEQQLNQDIQDLTLEMESFEQNFEAGDLTNPSFEAWLSNYEKAAKGIEAADYSVEERKGFVETLKKLWERFLDMLKRVRDFFTKKNQSNGSTAVSNEKIIKAVDEAVGKEVKDVDNADAKPVITAAKKADNVTEGKLVLTNFRQVTTPTVKAFLKDGKLTVESLKQYRRTYTKQFVDFMKLRKVKGKDNPFDPKERFKNELSGDTVEIANVENPRQVYNELMSLARFVNQKVTEMQAMAKEIETHFGKEIDQIDENDPELFNKVRGRMKNFPYLLEFLKRSIAIESAALGVAKAVAVNSLTIQPLTGK